MEIHLPVPMMIAAPPGSMSSSLRTFLQTIPGVQLVGSAPDLAAAYQMAAEKRPELLLLDADLVGRTPWDSFFQRIQAARPYIYCIVLVNDPAQEQLALRAGADRVILKGTLDQQLRDAIRSALDEY